jgi:Ca-activated chloride channel family protein
MIWAHPQAFWLLLLAPLAFWSLRRRQRGTACLSGLQAGTEAGRLAVWAPRLLAALRALALVFFVASLARPQTVDARSHAFSEGISIQLVLDTSNSMGYTDYTLDGQVVSRMEAARHAIRLFVKGDEKHKLAGRPHDLIGLVTFNRYPDVVCPLTHSHDTLLLALQETNLGPHTNIGDGLAWGLDRLRKAETEKKVLILLSDGKQNVKEAMNPEEAAGIAAELGVRIYCIGAVGNRGQSSGIGGLFGQLSPSPRGKQPPYNPADSIDEGVLERIAGRTGGQYYRATDTNGLLAIYREIDELEKTRMERQETVLFDEWFLWLLIPGLLILGLEQILGATRFLVVP